MKQKMNFTLSKDTVEKLEEMSKKEKRSKSGMIEWLVYNAYKLVGLLIIASCNDTHVTTDRYDYDDLGTNLSGSITFSPKELSSLYIEPSGIITDLIHSLPELPYIHNSFCGTTIIPTDFESDFYHGNVKIGENKIKDCE
jgi:hypothetical protein